ncbi:MAG: hypothetical protein AAFU79_28470 [Myxococcota bacterium]
MSERIPLLARRATNADDPDVITTHGVRNDHQAVALSCSKKQPALFFLGVVCVQTLNRILRVDRLRAFHEAQTVL